MGAQTNFARNGIMQTLHKAAKRGVFVVFQYQMCSFLSSMGSFLVQDEVRKVHFSDSHPLFQFRRYFFTACTKELFMSLTSL